jgi:hypothetical protein
MNGYWYYRRFETGKEYPIYARRKGKEGAEEILLNLNEMAQGHDFFDVGEIAISPDSCAHGRGPRTRSAAPVHHPRDGNRHAQGVSAGAVQRGEQRGLVRRQPDHSL